MIRNNQYREELCDLQQGYCAWCDKPLGRKTPAVDHNHRCCGSQDVCGMCIRGLVHSRCNIVEIAAADWAYERGYTLTPHDFEYITRGEISLYQDAIVDKIEEVGLTDLSSYSPIDDYHRGKEDEQLSSRFPLLWMREVEGFTNEIIAEKSGVSLATIKRRIRLEKLYARAVYSKATLERK
jgi:hypothetical protein